MVALDYRFARAIVRHPWVVLAFFALILPPAALLALRVGSDNSVGRLIVADDADARETRAFQALFPEGDYVVVLAEAEDPFDPAVLRRVEEIERAIARVGERVRPLSALTIWRQGGQAGSFRSFAAGTDLLRRQGLIGDGVLGIPTEIRSESPEGLARTLDALDAALRPFEERPAPLTAVRKIGRPYVDRYLSRETRRSTLLYMPLFGLFIVALNLVLYRSFRALVAFLLTVGATVVLTEATAGALGYVSTIVSSLVPMTVLITCTATLVYIHSLYVARPEERSAEEHHVFTLTNKLLPCTASIFAAAVGFAALAVSGIRPIREMGMWVAAGMGWTWLTAFTLFPALERVLRTPTQSERRTAGAWWPRVVAWLPAATYRARWTLVPAAIVLMLLGLTALLGIPGRIEPMRLETDALDYIDPDLPIVRDTRRFEATMSGLTVTEAWVKIPDGRALDPEVLRGLHRFARLLEADSRVGSVMGPTTLLQWVRYVSGQGDALPDDPAAWPKLAADLEQLLLDRPELRGYVDVGTLGNARLRVITRAGFGGYDALRRYLDATWAEAVSREPALAPCALSIVGEGVLQAKIAHYLVPTLTESFALTAAVIFLAFLLVFRSASARLMAMIPSLFAILTMFLVMRLTGIALNVATILIASTVLGASENDQIHFFYHFQEGRSRGGGTAEALRHAWTVSGRAIVFATLINAGGFLALALSPLPPMRQFGLVSASAFLLSMLADFTALPAALWLISRDRP
jgi:predicted RND superfamily exporter protein